MLKFEASLPLSADVLKAYFPATVHKSSYPNLLRLDISAVAVKALLVNYNYNLAQPFGYLRRFARVMCQNMSSVKASGYPKWTDVELALPELGEGWMYYPATKREIRTWRRPSVRAPRCARRRSSRWSCTNDTPAQRLAFRGHQGTVACVGATAVLGGTGVQSPHRNQPKRSELCQTIGADCRHSLLVRMTGRESLP